MRSRCQIDGCNSEMLARGYCTAHYRRWRLWGSPRPDIPLRATPGSLVKWLEEHVGHEGEECLAWPFSLRRGGYGQVYHEGKRSPASRVMCQMAHGKVDGLEAAHSCGNPLCVNPRHLRWATRQENENDKIGHGTRTCGEKNGSASLTRSQVEEIMRMRGKLPQRQLARMYGVGKSTIGRIHRGQTWTSVPVLIQPIEEEAA